jgi:hypothetical protein
VVGDVAASVDGRARASRGSDTTSARTAVNPILVLEYASIIAVSPHSSFQKHYLSAREAQLHA